jgi:hypothetical protein
MRNQRPQTKWLKYDEIRGMANEFRRRHQVDEEVCDIERVVEFGLGLHIIPRPGLRHLWGIDGYLTSDMTAIVVDDKCLQFYEATLRYTLAHEVAHLELHADLWQGLRYDTPEQFIEVITSVMSDDQYKGVEWQANAFAGLVLLPGERLRPVFQQAAETIYQATSSVEVKDNQTKFDVCLDVLCQDVGEHFVVHPVVVGVRADYDGLTDELADTMFGRGHRVQTRGRLLERP